METPLPQDQATLRDEPTVEAQARADAPHLSPILKPVARGADGHSDRSQPQPVPPAATKHSAVGRFLLAVGKRLSTLAIALVAILIALVAWQYYVKAPWTRNGSVRVQVASVAPQVSGQIVELRVADNQFVRKGDVLFIIDPFDFEVTVRTAKAQLAQKAADLEVKKAQAERRRHLSSLATTPEEQQIFAGNAAQAKAEFDAAEQQLAQAELNLKRTKIVSPVNGYITNLLLRVGDFTNTGVSNISIIDSSSYWIDGYFEETKTGADLRWRSGRGEAYGLCRADPRTRGHHHPGHQRIERHSGHSRVAQCRSDLHVGAPCATGAGSHSHRQCPAGRTARFRHDGDGDRPAGSRSRSRERLRSRALGCRGPAFRALLRPTAAAAGVRACHDPAVRADRVNSGTESAVGPDARADRSRSRPRDGYISTLISRTTDRPTMERRRLEIVARASAAISDEALRRI